MKKIFFITLSTTIIFFSVMSFFSAIHDKKGSPNQSVLKLLIKSDPLSFDPRKPSDGTTAALFSFLFEGLTKIDQQGRATLCLARDVKISEDRLTYTFFLHKAFWSDGTPIVAQDFKRSWLEVLNPQFGAYNPDYLFIIKNGQQYYNNEVTEEAVGINVLSEDCLSVTLAFASISFLEYLSNKMFFPVNDKGFFSGPFFLNGWKKQNFLSFKKNQFYRNQQEIFFDEIFFHITADPLTQLSIFEKNQSDWIGAPFTMFSYEDTSFLQNKEGAAFFQTDSVLGLIFNTTKYPLHQEKIRKALTYAINREDIIKHITLGSERPALTLLPSCLTTNLYNNFQNGKNLPRLELNEESIQSIENLVFSYPSLPSFHVLVQAIQQMWFEVFGVRVKLQAKEWQIYVNDLNNKNYDLALFGKGCNPIDPLYFLSHFMFKNRATNRCGWENSDFISCIEKARKAMNKKKRDELISEAEKILLNEMPIGPIYFQSGFYIKNPRLTNVVITPQGQVDFTRAYFN